MENKDVVVDLFWTGGWDSTFRLIQLLDEGYTVQPHYIKDNDRRSTCREIEAMEEIRSLLINKYEFGNTLLSTLISEKNQINNNPEIDDAYLSAINICYIGEQYRWLPKYCKDKGIEKIEFSVQNNSFIRENYRNSNYPYDPLFNRLEFPLINSSKKSMKDWCDKRGYFEVIEKSWFCHNPTKKGKACGRCNPCIIVVEEGLGYRLPPSAKIRYFLRINSRIKSLVKRFPKFYAFLFRIKHKA